ncbi:MAG: multidrug effflux MFS transporter [Sedimentisphaerales bacterium]|nr:multidrug effflux MFS transporter [Sedimentisphaerales bacterium]
MVVEKQKEHDLSRPEEIRYIFFLGLLATVPPLATDMYLAAMPTIARQWSVSEQQVSQSLVLWFLSFSISLLACGPIADKVGRRPVLLSGLVLFTVSTFLCAFSQGLGQLIFFRILQGIGASAPSSMSMAICRDRYQGSVRKNILAYISIILCMAPMVAPSIGAVLLKYYNWRSIFIAQGILSLISLLVSIPYKETLVEPLQTGWLGTFARYGSLVRNSRYMLCNSVMGLIPGPFYGYLALSPLAYIKIFGKSEFTFAIMFAVNALVSIAGAYSCTRFNRFIADRRLITYCLVGCIAGGAGMVFWGDKSFVLFAVFVALITYFSGMTRPLSNNLILEQVNTDIGSASSFIVFYQMFIGQFCMAITTYSWSNQIFAYGVLASAVPSLVLVVWLIFVSRLDAGSVRK